MSEAAQPIWVTRAAVAAGAFLLFGSVWQISSGSANTPRTPAPAAQMQSERTELAHAEAALRQAITEVESAMRQAERARRLLAAAGKHERTDVP